MLSKVCKPLPAILKSIQSGQVVWGKAICSQKEGAFSFLRRLCLLDICAWDDDPKCLYHSEKINQYFKLGLSIYKGEDRGEVSEAVSEMNIPNLPRGQWCAEYM